MFILRIHFSSIKHCPTTFSFSLDYKLSSIIKKTYLASKYSPYDKLIPGLASKAKEANCCVWYKDSAAAPIIAALSPQRLSGGNCKVTGRSNPSTAAVNWLRKPLLAATPPATSKWLIFGYWSKAEIVRPTN